MRTQILSTTSAKPTRFTDLRGGWLLLARIGWLAFALVALGLFMRGIPLRAEGVYQQYRPKLGVDLSASRSGEILLAPWGNYPAAQAGILAGDILVTVNGVAPQVEPGHSLEEIIPNGVAGTPVILQVRTGDHSVREYKVFLGGDNPLALARLGLSAEFIAGYLVAVEIIFGLVCLSIALLILFRKSQDALALLASLTFILILLGLSNYAVAVYDSQPVWRPALDLWFALIFFVLFSFFCLFPDGQFRSRWTLAFVIAGFVWLVAQGLYPQLYPWKLRSPQIGFGVMAAWLGAGIIFQIYRYRYSSRPDQRQRTQWAVLGMIVSVFGLLGQVVPLARSLPAGSPTLFFDLVGYPAAQLFKLFLPLTIAIAILRHRLWEIDSFLNRTLVYGALSALVIGIYVIVVGALGTTLQGLGNLLISILATGLVAVLFQPLRDYLQRGVNRLMYGERDDPGTVLARLGHRLQATLAPEAVLPALVETIAQTLKLPYAAITWGVENNGDAAAAYGQPVDELTRLPLVHQGEIIGQLVVGPRAPGEGFSSADRRLLENIAHQAGMAVHAVSLTIDLHRSRQRLVTAREEERRRLRRDLHDGLGPNLASQGLKLAAVKRLLETNPGTAAPLLDQVMAQNQATVDEVRRLVYGLRPPALDELGLVAAIRDYVAGMEGNAGLHIEVTEPPTGLPLLSAAVEVAAYRIILEALTNVIRHAQAQRCTIRFALKPPGSQDRLHVEVQDDGMGLPRVHRLGIGIRSMRERAEEVGGTCVVEPVAAGGTRVQAQLPLVNTLER